MRISNDDYRRLAHSIKYLEFYWGEYKTTFPDEYKEYPSYSDIDYYLKMNLYSQFRKVKVDRLTRDITLTTKQYQGMQHYAEICHDVKLSLMLWKDEEGNNKKEWQM